MSALGELSYTEEDLRQVRVPTVTQLLCEFCLKVLPNLKLKTSQDLSEAWELWMDELFESKRITRSHRDRWKNPFHHINSIKRTR